MCPNFRNGVLISRLDAYIYNGPGCNMHTYIYGVLKCVCVCVCRQDYLYAHKDVVPSLEGAASQLNTLKKELRLERVFLASDASLEGKWFICWMKECWKYLVLLPKILCLVFV